MSSRVLFTCTYDSYNLPEGLFGSYDARLGTKSLRISTAKEVGLDVMAMFSTNRSTLFDYGKLITTRWASLWFSFYSNLTLIIYGSLPKYLLRLI